VDRNIHPNFNKGEALLIDKKLIIEAKEKFGERAIELIREHFNLENWDEKNSKGSCPFGHSDSNPSFIWNPKNYSFHCFSCNRNFGILDLFMRQHMTYLEAVEKLFDEVDVKYKFGERGVKSKRNYRYPIVEYSDDRTKVEKYFELRKISKETLDYCNIGQDTSGNIVWKFFDENDTLLTVKVRPARKIKDGEDKEWYLPNFDYTPILYNMNKVDCSNGPLVITEGQPDALSIIESGYYNVVSVPGGSLNLKWIEECYDWLEKFDSIIIWSDTDDAGIKMRKEVISRLGQWRCKYVEIPEDFMQGNKDMKDANAILFKYGKQIVLDLIFNAQEMPIVGVTDLSLADDFEIENSPGLYTHIDKIDEIIYKFLFGSVVLVTGTRGAGKSTLLNQVFVCESLDQGYDTFIYSGELSTPILKSWIELSMAGREVTTMKDRFVHVIESESRKQMREWYKERIWVYDQLSNDADDVLDKAITVTRKYGCKIWILDNLMTLDLKSNDNNLYEKQKEFINKLIRLANLYGVLIVLVTHPRKLQAGFELGADDISGSNSMSNLTQYIMSVKRYTDKEKHGEKDSKGNYKAGKSPVEYDVAINIIKNRFTGRVGSEDLYFDYTSYRFYRTPQELFKRFKWNKNTSSIPTKDPNNHSDEPDWARN